MSTQRRYQIAVCGSAVVESETVAQAADAIGHEIAKRGFILLTGGTNGYPQRAAQSAQAAGGLSIGISPAANRSQHVKDYKIPLHEYDVLVLTGMGFSGRNVTLVRSADAVIFVGGRMGTVNEFTTAHSEMKVIGILSGSSANMDLLPQLAANAHRPGGVILCDADPVALVAKVIAQLDATESGELYG